MASLEECQAALDELARMIGDVDDDARQRHALERSVSCEVTDLDVVFRGDLRNGTLHDVRMAHEADRRADIRLRLSSDDLVALVRGQLDLAKAWATGRVRIDASLTDLLRLRTLL